MAVTEHYDSIAWTEVADLSTARSELAGSGPTALNALAIGGTTGSVSALTEEWSHAQNAKIIPD